MHHFVDIIPISFSFLDIIHHLCAYYPFGASALSFLVIDVKTGYTYATYIKGGETLEAYGY